VRYNLLAFTDTNSVICKIIVGGLASLFEGGGICEANDGRSVVRTMGHSPSHGLRRASPLIEGAEGCRRKGERYMKATGERCDRCLWQEKRAERVAAVCVQRGRTVAKAHTGHRNRNCQKSGRFGKNRYS